MNAIKPFFTNRGIITNDSITLEENGVLKNDPKETTEVFNNYFINIVETTSGRRPSSIGNSNFQCQDRKSLKIIESYKNHSSVATIKENVLPDFLGFELRPASKEDIKKIVKSLNVNKATGPDGMLLKLIKLSANVVVDKYLTNIINHDISRSCFSDAANNSLVRTIYKKKDRKDKENYRLMDILNGFSKVYERLINDIMLRVIQTFLSNFLSAYRKYSANPVLISLIKN